MFDLYQRATLMESDCRRRWATSEVGSEARIGTELGMSDCIAEQILLETELMSEAKLPTDSKDRKSTPITTGVLDYFPLAIAEVARVSKAGNDQHNPGQPLHWAREKSTDHADCIGRHLLERGSIDIDGQRHSAKLAWRALANLQEELEKERQETGCGKPFGAGSDVKAELIPNGHTYHHTPPGPRHARMRPITRNRSVDNIVVADDVQPARARSHDLR